MAKQLHSNPPEERILGDCDHQHLQDDLYCLHAFGYAQYLVVLLVCVEEYLAVVEEVSQDGTGENYGEQDVGVTQRQGCLGEDEGEEAHQDAGCRNHDECYLAVQPSLNRYDFLDVLVVLVEQRLVQEESHGASYTQLGEVEEGEDVLRRGTQAQYFAAQILEEQFPGEEAQDNDEQVVCRRYYRILNAFLCPGVCLAHQCLCKSCKFTIIL